MYFIKYIYTDYQGITCKGFRPSLAFFWGGNITMHEENQ